MATTAAQAGTEFPEHPVFLEIEEESVSQGNRVPAVIQAAPDHRGQEGREGNQEMQDPEATQG